MVLSCRTEDTRHVTSTLARTLDKDCKRPWLTLRSHRDLPRLITLIFPSKLARLANRIIKDRFNSIHCDWLRFEMRGIGHTCWHGNKQYHSCATSTYNNTWIVTCLAWYVINQRTHAHFAYVLVHGSWNMWCVNMWSSPWCTHETSAE